jgi:hypothetical protein
MPTVLRVGPYRFFFFAGDRDEPMHVHIERDDALAKFWTSPVRLHHSTGFSRSELTKLEALVTENQRQIEESWNDYFAD